MLIIPNTTNAVAFAIISSKTTFRGVIFLLYFICIILVYATKFGAMTAGAHSPRRRFAGRRGRSPGLRSLGLGNAGSQPASSARPPSSIKKCRQYCQHFSCQNQTNPYSSSSPLTAKNSSPSCASGSGNSSSNLKSSTFLKSEFDSGCSASSSTFILSMSSE